MLQHLIFFFKQFSQRGPLQTTDFELTICRTVDMECVR